MKTEDVLLNVKEIFDKKKASYSPADIARARYACKIFVENMIELRKLCNQEGNGEAVIELPRGEQDD